MKLESLLSRKDRQKIRNFALDLEAKGLSPFLKRARKRRHGRRQIRPAAKKKQPS